MASPRRYQETHPWISFVYRPAMSGVSAKLGEAYSKCRHMLGTPLQPALAADLSSFYLAKGTHATTAIEGNTLNESEVREILDSGRTLPPSQEYLEREVRNVALVLADIHRGAPRTTSWTVSPDWLRAQNKQILAGIDVPDHVVPGEYTEVALGVGSVYRGAPPEDVPCLVDDLCRWLNTMIEHAICDDLPEDQRFFQAFYAAVLGHLYLAWIHPFGDGNGRTARALECAILVHSGVVPWVSSTALSDHYNRTRNRYYDRLNAASKSGEVDQFIHYAAEGFVDLLREQTGDIQRMQRRVAWINFVHEVFQDKTQGITSKRRRALVLALPENTLTPRNKLRHLSPELAEMYATVGDKTVSHDTNALKRLDLIAGDARGGFEPLIRRMDAFLPDRL